MLKKNKLEKKERKREAHRKQALVERAKEAQAKKEAKKAELHAPSVQRGIAVAADIRAKKAQMESIEAKMKAVQQRLEEKKRDVAKVKLAIGVPMYERFMKKTR